MHRIWTDVSELKLADHFRRTVVSLVFQDTSRGQIESSLNRLSTDAVIRGSKREPGAGLLDFVPNLSVPLVTIPNADDILVRPYANGAAAYPGPLIWLFIGWWLEIVELFSKNGEDKVFP